jgi:hypothetical protein
MTILLALALTCCPRQSGQPDSVLVHREFEEVLDDEHDEQVAWFKTHPLDLNCAGLSELEEIPGITASGAMEVVALRSRLVRFRSVEELQLLGNDLFIRIREFVTVSSPSVAGRAQARRRGGARLRTERIITGSPAGETFPGEGSIWSKRASIEIPLWGRGSFSVSGETDPGELWRHGFAGACADLEGPGLLRRVIVGDYRVSAAQGLALSGARFSSGTGDPLAVVRAPGRVLTPHRSWGESGFLRGCAVSFGPVRDGDREVASVFLSYRPLAASVNEMAEVTSLDETGLVRTAAEMDRQRAVHETVCGFRVLGRPGQKVHAGLSAYIHRLDHEWAPLPSRAARASRHRVLAVDAGYVSRVFSCEGEVAVSNPGTTAWIAWCLLSPAPGSRVVAGFRELAPDFVAPLGRSSPSAGAQTNERGWYLGWDIVPLPWCALSGSLDVSRALNGTITERSPKEEARVTLQGDARLSRSFEVAVRLALKNTGTCERAEDQEGRETRRTVQRRSVSERITLTLLASRSLRVRARVEYVRVVPGGRPAETGFLVFKEIRWNPSERLAVTGRVTLADADSYDSRLYVAEPDAEGITHVRAYSRRGVTLTGLIRAPLVDSLCAGAGITWNDRPGWIDGGESRDDLTSAGVVIFLSLIP